jgi:hypothetical protein
MKKTTKADIIIDTLRSCFNYGSDVILGKELFDGKSQSSVGTWRTRDSYRIILMKIEMPELITYFDSDEPEKIQIAINRIKDKYSKYSADRNPLAPSENSQTPTDNLIRLCIQESASEDMKKENEHYLEKTLYVLESGTRHARSLKENIDSFYEAVNDKKERNGFQKQLDDLRDYVKTIEDRLPKTGQ